ncbi:LysM domain-containing protein [Mangrovimicrobium sediminis]|uniref:LysM domain-containing protein n=1 Tax=Mangrovimicrobium sediminis TaxID=2562682 RepID=A0A4Z0M9W1_9GAMM|nr:LysM peptidoglycan-binding domain-containing protein [Haliea sp. SAOS-164]TGD76180.1 LysM domain-containing protein [Haliea sp. SAOS-164]
MSTAKAPAVIIADWGQGGQETYEVQYNPKEFSLEKSLQHGEINIPGLDAPLQQFVRGQAEKLSVELFFDTTENGTGKDATSVTDHTDRIYKLAKVENSSHAPAVVTFCWNSKFPGSSLSYGEQGGGASGNQTRNSFVGVVESVRQQFTLFSAEGVPLRATVNLVLKEFRTLDEQLKQMRLNSPDRTHSHPVSDGETLATIAARYYGRGGRWRHIADANSVADPRRLGAGRTLTVPAIK